MSKAKPKAAKPNKGKGKAAAPAATLAPPVPVAPANRRGQSQVENPVGVAWVECLNATKANGGLLTRREYTRLVVEAGVTYYTARTQVNRYLQWEAGGRQGKLPRAVDLH